MDRRGKEDHMSDIHALREKWRKRRDGYEQYRLDAVKERRDSLAAFYNGKAEAAGVICDELDTLLASLSSDPAQGWQDIETAPKDGTEVLLLFPSDTKRTGYWAKSIQRWSVDAVVSMPLPTHWMPLPEPPKVSTT
jgi:hypothetical protein